MFLKKSDKLAIVDFDGKKIKYNEMIDSIKYLSRKIFNNINKDDKVIILAENRLEWIYSYFAIWDKEAVVIAIDALSTSDELQYFLNDSETRKIIVTNKTKKVLENIDLDLVVYNLDEIKIETLEDDKELLHPLENDLALMIYTSGTTGNPKGVMLSFNNLYNEIQSIKNLEVTMENEKVLAMLPFHHILPLMTTCLYCFIYENSYSVILVPSLTSQDILRCIKDNNVTVISAVPRVYKLFYKSLSEKINSNFIAKTMFNICKKVNNTKFSRFVFSKVHKEFGGNLRVFISGGAKANVEMIEFFNTLGFLYSEGYGLSETAPVVAGSVLKHYKAGTIGKPVFNAQIKVVNKELWVKGPMVMLGYYNKPEKTREVITEDGWLKTGDLVETDDDGFITIIGRANSMIVLSNGKNIDPEKLEEKVMNEANNLISEIGIFGKNDKLSAIIVPDFAYIRKEKIGNISTYIRDIIQVYNSKVHNYEKILDYKIMEQELPKTRVGKIRRFMLPEVFGGKVEKKKIENEPDTKEYKVLKEYIKKLKDIDEISLSDSFEVELGLDSLDFVEFITYLENSYGIKIDESIFATHYNLKLLSEYIEKNSKGFNNVEMKFDEIIKNVEVKKVKIGYLQYIATPFVYLFSKLYFRLGIKGSEKIKDKPTIFIANHESFADAPLLALAIPYEMRKKTYFLGLEQYFSKGIMKHIANNGNVITINIEKNIKETIEKISNVLKQGKNIFIFPEGSRTKDGELQEFKKVFAIIAKELDIDIQCIGINGAYEAYSRFMLLPRPKKISVEVLESIKPTGKSYEEIVKECEEVFREYKKNN